MTAFLGGLTQFFIPSHLLAVVALGLLAGQNAPRFPFGAFAAFRGRTARGLDHGGVRDP